MVPAFLISLAGVAVLAGAAFLAYRLQWWALAAIVPMCAGLFFFSVAGQSTASLATPLVLGAAGGLTFRKGASLKVYLIACTLILTAVTSGNYYYMLLEKKIDLIEVSRSEMALMLEQQKAPAEFKDALLGNFSLDDFNKYRQEIQNVMPFFFFLNALVMTSLAYLGMKVFFLRFAGGIRAPGLEFFRLNDYMILTLILGLGVFLLVDSGQYRLVYSAGLNLLLFSGVLYCIQALGVIKFMIIKKGLPGYLLPLIFFIIILLGIGVIVFTLVLLTGFGTLDFWADFRKLGENSNIRSEQQ